ncbi:MAG: FAD-dependent oxidoreductase [Gammaproteobacteria bacterium]|nr:FAD-dependent oxidoreductase [Gammaproteobacteria bacterium]
MAPVIIIGSGLAGYGVAKEFRKLDTATPLMIITGDDGRSYSKPMLSNAISKGKTADQLAMADASAMAAQLNADIRSQTRVTAINSAAHEISIGNERIKYSQLVLALGANPIRLSLNGDAADAVLSVNSLQDYDQFRRAIEGRKSIVILGGGLIGCEFANDLANGGYHVDILDRNPLPLGRLLPEVVGAKLQQKLKSIGVVWHGSETVSRIDRSDGRFRVCLVSGQEIVADVVLSAIGLQPNIGLARTAGLTVNRGIVVDQFLRTSAEDIYALGDCAEVVGHVLPFVMPLMRAVRALGPTLAGRPTKVIYPAMPVAVKTPVFPIVISPPAQSAAGAWQIEAEGDDIRAMFMGEGGEKKGFVLAGAIVGEAHKLATQITGLLG